MSNSAAAACKLPCDVSCALCDEFCDDIDGRYGGRLIFDRIFTEDELRLFEQLSPNDDGESFAAGLRCIVCNRK